MSLFERIAKLRCRVGFHDWKLSKGIGYTHGDNPRMAIFFDKDCRRCGKHEDGAMWA